MTYEQYEDAIVERLKMQGVDVAVLPHIDALNDARPTAKPQVFVIFHGGDFAERENLTVTSQLETLRFEVFIRAKHRRGKLGVFQVHDEVSRRLLGYKLKDAQSVITFTSFGYVAGIQNNWQYALTFSFARYRVEDLEAEPVIPIKKITINEKNNLL